MKHSWFVSSLSITALVLGTAWTQPGAAYAVGFTPPADNAAPRGSTGGASRGGFFTPPSDRAAPRRATGGASRGIFTNSDELMEAEGMETANSSSRSNVYGETASIPNSAGTSMLAVTPDSFFGTTLEARPTILVYVPPSGSDEAVFSIKDEVKNSVYQMSLAVPSTGGVVAVVVLPADAPELTGNQNYQ